VAGSAGHVGMAIAKQESRRAVIESAGVPARRSVAGAACCYWKCGRGRRVRRIIGLLPGRQMAPGIAAIVQRGRQIVIIVDVAGCAGHIGVPLR